MLGKVFGVMTLVALTFGLVGGRGEEMASGVLEGASRAVEVTLTLAGMMCLCGFFFFLSYFYWYGLGHEFSLVAKP